MKSKRKYYSEKLLQFQGDTKKTWRIMKEEIGKFKLIHSAVPRKFGINKNVIFEEKWIANAFKRMRTIQQFLQTHSTIFANAFNNFFINIGPKLAEDIPTATRSF